MDEQAKYKRTDKIYFAKLNKTIKILAGVFFMKKIFASIFFILVTFFIYSEEFDNGIFGKSKESILLENINSNIEFKQKDNTVIVKEPNLTLLNFNISNVGYIFDDQNKLKFISLFVEEESVNLFYKKVFNLISEKKLKISPNYPKDMPVCYDAENEIIWSFSYAEHKMPIYLIYIQDISL